MLDDRYLVVSKGTPQGREHMWGPRLTLVTMPASSWPGTRGYLEAQGPCLMKPRAHITSPWQIPQYTAQTKVSVTS
jgi:hypothetical protein